MGGSSGLAKSSPAPKAAPSSKNSSVAGSLNRPPEGVQRSTTTSPLAKEKEPEKHKAKDKLKEKEAVKEKPKAKEKEKKAKEENEKEKEKEQEKEKEKEKKEKEEKEKEKAKDGKENEAVPRQGVKVATARKPQPPVPEKVSPSSPSHSRSHHRAHTD